MMPIASRAVKSAGLAKGVLETTLQRTTRDCGYLERDLISRRLSCCGVCYIYALQLSNV